MSDMETCLTCSSNEDLTILKDGEWRNFESMYYSDNKSVLDIIKPYCIYLKNRNLGRVCSSCKNIMQDIDKFKKTALENVLTLIQVWNKDARPSNTRYADLLEQKETVQEAKWKAQHFVALNSDFNEDPLIIAPPSPKPCESGMIKMEIKIESDTEENDVLDQIVDITSGEIPVESPTLKQEPGVLAQNCVIPTKPKKLIIPIIQKKLIIPIKHQKLRGMPHDSDTMQQSFRVTSGNSAGLKIQQYSRVPAQSSVIAIGTTQQNLREIAQNSGTPVMDGDSAIPTTEKLKVMGGVGDTDNSHEGPSVPLLDNSCPICGKYLVSAVATRQHIKAMHGPKVYCEACDKFYTKRMYQKHLKVSKLHKRKTEKPLMMYPQPEEFYTRCCPICRKEFKTASTMRSHKTFVHTPKVHCGTCKRSITRGRYKQHIKNCLAEMIRRENALKNRPKTRKIPEDISAQDVRVPCEICKKEYPKRSIKLHIKGHDATNYCKLCDKWYSDFSYKCHLQFSLKHVTKDNYRFACDQCDARFNAAGVLKRHVQSVHLKIFPFQCSQCDRKFSTQGLLNKHGKVVHENLPLPKNFVCDVCGRAWASKKLLADHMVVHTGARPYKCGVCDATFGHSGARYTHNKLKHEKKKQKVYKKTKRNANKTSKEEGNA